MVFNDVFTLWIIFTNKLNKINAKRKDQKQMRCFLQLKKKKNNNNVQLKV